MLNTNSVVFKGRKNGIVILLDDKISFDELKEVFLEKMVDARKFFDGRKAPIIFQGRELTEEQEAELLKIISDEANVNISFFRSSMPETEKPPEAAAGVPEAVKNYWNPNPYEQKALFNTGSLRSGQSISYSGTVVVIGDVNPGAEIIAGGNIIVLGTLKGFAHAGSSGDSTCFIYANELAPVQLRIADLITVMPKIEAGERRFILKKKKIPVPMPSRAYVSEGQIYIVQI